jgi:hypothetical protein
MHGRSREKSRGRFLQIIAFMCLQKQRVFAFVTKRLKNDENVGKTAKIVEIVCESTG